MPDCPAPSLRPDPAPSAASDAAFLGAVADELRDDPAVVTRLSLRVLRVLEGWRAGRPAVKEAQGAMAAAAAALAFTIYE